MALTVGKANSGTVSGVGKASGGGIGGPSTSSGANIIATFNPQSTASVQQLQPTVDASINQRPYVVPKSGGSGSTGGGGGGGSQTYVDPYAKWGGLAGYNRAVSDYNSAKNSAYGSVNDAIGDAGRGMNSSVLDYLDSLTKGQRAIDNSSIQNELARMSGRAGVLDMIGTGINSGGVVLSNKGAINSSAADALARAYNTIGQKQLSGVNNQYETGNMNIQQQQQDLNDQTKQFQRHLEDNKQTAVNKIVQDASSALASLNAAAQNASLADRIDIEGQKAAIRNQALSSLAQYDTTLSNGIAGVTPSTVDANRAKASSMITAGVAPDNAFSYSTTVPTQWQGTGPFASPLAVFSPSRKQQDALPAVGV